MTFEDLPTGWQSRPLTDARITDDVLDLVISGRDRDQGAIHILLCDPADRLMQPCAVGELDDRAWHQAAIDACRDSRVRLLGVHVVTHSGSVRLGR